MDKKRIGAMVRGVKVYDPRDNSWKISDNPFWDWIGEIADVCDYQRSR